MKLLARMMMVVALLGVLAYGSFAFGKYVLSAKLFGEETKSGSLRTVSRSTTQASAVTRQTGWKGAKPRVEVKVLPASETAAAPDVPAFPDEDGFNEKPRTKKTDSDRPSRMETDSPDNSSNDNSGEASPNKPGVKRNVDAGSPQYSLGGENGSVKNDDDGPVTTTSKRRKKRRRRKRSSNRSNASVRNSRPARSDTARGESTPTGDGRGDDSSISVTTDHSPARETSPRTPRRTRERPRRESSPVPRPESSGGDSGSISPVPQPE